MYTRFVVVTLILLGFLSTADARRHHGRHHLRYDNHRVFEPDRSSSVLDTPSVFDTGTGRTRWLELSPLELMMLDVPVRPRIVWLDNTKTIVVEHHPDYWRILGWLMVLAGLINLSYVGARAYSEADKPVVLLRVQPGSSRRWNVIRLWCKQAWTFALESYRSHTLGTMRRRKKSPEVLWGLHHTPLF